MILDPRELNAHLGINAGVTAPKVCPCAQIVDVHGGVKFSSVTSRKLRMLLP